LNSFYWCFMTPYNFYLLLSEKRETNLGENHVKREI